MKLFNFRFNKVVRRILIVAVCYFMSWSTFSQKDSLSFLALGDSYTVGTSELNEHSWPVQLQLLLAKKEVLLKNPKVIAGAGWTTEKLLEELRLQAPNKSYDIVSLLIGVNNQYRNQSIAAFKEDLQLLLDESIKHAANDSSKVFVLSIPDWSKTPFARLKDKDKIARELKEYNEIVKKEAEGKGILFIDITKISQKAFFDKDLIAKDSLHPSRKMYKAWSRKISKEMKKKNFYDP